MTMEVKVIVAILAVVGAVAMVEAQRGRNRGGRPRPPPQLPDGDVYNWSRNVSGSSVDESAFVPTGSNLVIVRSFDDGLRNLSRNRASLLYDFSTPNPLVVIGSFGPCFLTSTNLTYLEVIDILDARNGSSATTNAQFSLDGTALPLPFEQVRQLFDTYPSLRRACRDGRVIVTTPGQETLVPFPTEELSVLAVDAEISIRIPQRPVRQPRPTGGFVNPGQNRFGPGRRPTSATGDQLTTAYPTTGQDATTTAVPTAGSTTAYPSP